MAVIKQQGTQPFGSQVVKIPSSTGVDYIASNISYDRPGSTIDHTDEIGNVDGFAITTPSSSGGSMDLMLSGTSIDLPARGAAFTFALPGTSKTCTANVESAGFTESPGAYKTARITFKDQAFTA